MATVSHELRTPLTSIVGYTEILMDMDPGDVSPEARAMLEVIERNADRELANPRRRPAHHRPDP